MYDERLEKFPKVKPQNMSQDFFSFLKRKYGKGMKKKASHLDEIKK